MYGCVKTGEYGVQSELIDIIDNSTYNKKSTQADVLPFGFCVALAKGDKTKAVILLQTLGNLGIKTVFGKYINRCMLENKIDYSIVWGPLYPKQYIQRILQKGVLQKIRMIRYEIPEDTIDRLGVNNGVKLKEERVIIHPVGFLHNKEKQLKEWLNGQRASTKIIELPDFEYEQLKFEFEINKKKKTINLNDTEELRINEDITDSVRMENGVPTFESVKECLKITSYEYLKLIGFIAK